MQLLPGYLVSTHRTLLYHKDEASNLASWVTVAKATYSASHEDNAVINRLLLRFHDVHDISEF